MKNQSEIIYPESIMAHLTSFESCPVFDKNRAKVRLCVCSGVLVTVTYGHDRFSWRSRHVWTIYMTWPNGLCFSAKMWRKLNIIEKIPGISREIFELQNRSREFEEFFKNVLKFVEKLLKKFSTKFSEIVRNSKEYWKQFVIFLSYFKIKFR